MRGIIVFLIIFLTLFSLLPTVYELANRNNLAANRQFELVHNFPTDYNFYLSRIRQGIEGRATVVEKYTSEPHNGSFIHVFYLALGWVGRWVRVPWERAGDVYHVTRIVLAVTLLTLIAQFAKRNFRVPLWGVIAFLFAVTASTWPKLVFYNGGWRFGGYMPWWSLMDSLQRITFIPHLLAGQALILFLVMVISDDDAMKRSGNWIFLGILAFLLGVIFPPGFLFFGVTTVIYFLIKKLKGASGGLIVCLLGLPSLVYLQLMTSFYPWKRLAEFDIVKPLPFDYLEYLKAVGPILPLGVIGLIFVLKRKETNLFSSVAWVLAWAVLLFVFRFIPQQSPLRFSEMMPHVPLATLATYVFYNIYNNYNNYIRLFVAALILVGVGVMVSSWWWQRDFVDHKLRAAFPLVPTGSYVMYPLKDFISGMKFLQDATSRDSVILSETTAGNYLPVYSGNTVYIGHANTVRAEEKEVVVKRFFSGQMKADEAKTWLAQNNLQYVFFGPQEKEDGGVVELHKVYPFIQEVYSNSFVKIYNVP